MKLKEKANNLPKGPGVYLMKDFMGNIIYIGKSKNLNNRVSSYFFNNKSHNPKIVHMVNNIDTFEYIMSDTELDALLLESRLIKTYKPLYNRLLKNTKSYSYIKITRDREFPTISIENSKNDDKSLYFGPFTSLNPLERAVDFIKDYFPITKCKDPLKGKKSPCLYYDLGKCIGVCKNIEDNSEYLGYINNIIDLIMGKDTVPIENIRDKMNKSSKDLDFKKAKEYRDQLFGINYVIRRIKTIKTTRSKKNLLVMEKKDKENFKLYLIKGNILIHQELINKDNLLQDSFKKDIKYKILNGFNNLKKDMYRDISKDDIDEILIIDSYINSKRDNLIYYNIPNTWISNSYKIEELVDDLIHKTTC